MEVILGGVVGGELEECTLKFEGYFVVDEGSMDVFVCKVVEGGLNVCGCNCEWESPDVVFVYQLVYVGLYVCCSVV